MKIRKLVASDLISVSAIIGKLGNDKGFSLDTLFGDIFKNLGKVEDEVFAFIGSLYGISKEEVASMPLPEFGNLLNGLIKSDDILGFFTSFNK
jgi:hypothetical protein